MSLIKFWLLLYNSYVVPWLFACQLSLSLAGASLCFSWSLSHLHGFIWQLWGIVAFFPLDYSNSSNRYYLSTSRELKRLDAVSRSPIFAWFSESLAGASTIKAYTQQSVFITNNQGRLDRNQICYLPSIYVNRWLAVRLEFVGAIIILVVATLSIVALRTTGLDAGLAGLVLSYALNTTSSLVRTEEKYLTDFSNVWFRIGWFAQRARWSKI